MIERDKPKEVAVCDVCRHYGRTCTDDPKKIARCLPVIEFASAAAVYFAEMGVTV